VPKDVRIWEIEAGEQLAEFRKAKLDLEERIETWLEQDISIISDDLLVIDRQSVTEFGGVIDLLCLDRSGDAVVVELKRDKTPRDITAQVLDYASWVKDLSNERITELADQFLGDKGPLERAFEQRFGDELPETLNGQHKLLIVASDIDPSTERIVNYLSDTYGVDINAVSFQYFRHGESEFLARVFLIDPSQVEQSKRTKSASKRRPNLTYEELAQIAEENDVGELYGQLTEGLQTCFDQKYTTLSTLGFIGIIDGHRKTIFSLAPGKSNVEQGVRFYTFIDRLVEYLGTTREQVIALFPRDAKDSIPWQGANIQIEGFFKTTDEVARLVDGLRELREQ
jgi:uncharacterized protein YeaO (DUF488 family)